ncbi:DNA/RNA non-specific endonuclease [Mollicutes bacterium LVI A0078]|nr:DNA/RNA non-specific endonuclease [Mollicutes bacterium LVI A0075]WOO91768.1 DNA/RNA non-specific endonuclease [Mollicutes bacterium LVI A0078]
MKLKLLLVLTVLMASSVTVVSAATISVDACNLSGTRVANAKVDIGFDSSYANRDYFAYTNGTGQLYKVTAEDIVLQNDSKEPVNSTGRYCSDEAKVPGTEQSDLDEGHVIADSLGGVSNAYNITPQASSVNRAGGPQYSFEQEILKAEQSGKQVTSFSATIKYPNTKTQIPTSYSVSYKIDGVLKSYSFDNDNYTSSNTKVVVKDNYNGNHILKTYYTNGVKTKAVESTKGGRRLKVYTYHTNGKVKQRVSYENTTANNRTETVQYNTSGKKTFLYTYHSNGKTKRKYIYSSGVKSEVIEYYSTGKYKFKWTYHSNGKVLRKYTYNTSGVRTNAIEYTSAGKKKYTWTYHSNGKVLRKYTYNTSGVRTNAIEYTSTGKKKYTWTYHSNGKLKQKTTFKADGKVTDAKVYTTAGKLLYDYDYRSNGKILKKKKYNTSNKIIKTYYYNPAGKYDAKWEKSTKYSSCAKMDNAGITTPVPKGTNMYKANVSRDRDKDGLLCE